MLPILWEYRRLENKKATQMSGLDAPYETRTRVSALRGPRPRPLDEQG